MAKKICSICQVRPVGSVPSVGDAVQAKSMGYCTPCLTLAEMENHHSDNGHETIDALTVKGSAFRTRKELDEWRDSEKSIMEQCWVCRPELDATQAEYVERAGTSRADARLTIAIRATGREKANSVSAKLGESYKIRITAPKKSDRVWLRAENAGESVELVWDVRGRFLAGTVSTAAVEGQAPRPRSVRNVSETYRILGIEI